MGGPRADVGTLVNGHFKVPEFPHPCRGDFFLAKSPVFGKAKDLLRLEDAYEDLNLVVI